MPTTPDQFLPKIEYDRSSGRYVTRRAFNVLLLLTLANLFCSFQFLYYPKASAYVRERLEQHRVAVARAAAVGQQLALEKQCLAHAPPPGKIVWDDNPDTAAKLLAGPGCLPGYILFVDNSMLSEAYLAKFWPRSACAAPLPFLRQLIPGHDDGWDHYTCPGEQTSVFLHGLRSVGGPERLVRVDLYTSPWLPHEAGELGLGKAWAGKLSEAQKFCAGAFALHQGRSPPQHCSYSESILHTILEDIGSAAWSPGSPAGQPGRLTVSTRDKLRVFAGQPDPADPSHFTIRYQLNEADGTIDGWLKGDDSIRLSPRSGAVRDISLPVGPPTQCWDPHAK